jgi:hypothetical protein
LTTIYDHEGNNPWRTGDPFLVDCANCKAEFLATEPTLGNRYFVCPSCYPKTEDEGNQMLRKLTDASLITLRLDGDDDIDFNDPTLMPPAGWFRPMTQHPQDREPFGGDELDIEFNDPNLMKPCNWFQGSRTNPLPPDAQLEFEEKLSDIMEDEIEKAQDDDSDVKDIDFNDPQAELNN